MNQHSQKELNAENILLKTYLEAAKFTTSAYFYVLSEQQKKVLKSRAAPHTFIPVGQW